ncbi:uncharacterized protein LOC111905002 [Lactuca sativa]|uniref:uncharacterized protein LOC111905002 n=1 Tax=Lactuca sativa TaxID=4236 RepID=UPI000CD9B41A|nr:uncharacterized protein LOC111905002 [Lactuca sativa]
MVESEEVELELKDAKYRLDIDHYDLENHTKCGSRGSESNGVGGDDKGIKARVSGDDVGSGGDENGGGGGDNNDSIGGGKSGGDASSGGRQRGNDGHGGRGGGSGNIRGISCDSGVGVGGYRRCPKTGCYTAFSESTGNGWRNVGCDGSSWRKGGPLLVDSSYVHDTGYECRIISILSRLGVGGALDN